MRLLPLTCSSATSSMNQTSTGGTTSGRAHSMEQRVERTAWREGVQGWGEATRGRLAAARVSLVAPGRPSGRRVEVRSRGIEDGMWASSRQGLFIQHASGPKTKLNGPS